MNNNLKLTAIMNDHAARKSACMQARKSACMQAGNGKQ